MTARRDRRFALAACLIVIVFSGGGGVCLPIADADPTTSKGTFTDSGTIEFSPSRRRSPFYDEVEAVVPTARTKLQKVPTARTAPPVAAPPSGPESSLTLDSPGFVGQLDITAIGKTPLPTSHDQSEGDTDPSPGSSARGGFSSSVIWAIGILAVGWLARVLLKSGGALSVGGPTGMELLSRQSIGPQQQLALVRLGQRILLIGATPTGMSTLTTVDEPADVQAILSDLRPESRPTSPTVLDLFRSRRSPTASATSSATPPVVLSTSSRVAETDRRPVSVTNREVSDG